MPWTDLNKTRILALLVYNFIHEKHWVSIRKHIHQCQEAWQIPRMHTAHPIASLANTRKVTPTQGQGDPLLTLHNSQAATILKITSIASLKSFSKEPAMCNVAFIYFLTIKLC